MVSILLSTDSIIKATELYLINFVCGDLNSKLPTLSNLGLYRSSVAGSLGLCEAQVGRIDFVEATGSFKNRNFFLKKLLLQENARRSAF
jgi:hypothetical protein